MFLLENKPFSDSQINNYEKDNDFDLISKQSHILFPLNKILHNKIFIQFTNSNYISSDHKQFKRNYRNNKSIYKIH